MRVMFNCTQQYDPASQPQHLMPLEDGSDSELFLASDVEPDHSGLSETEGSVFFASDTEQNERTREYQTRRLSNPTFLDKPICISALQALLGVGSSTLQRIRSGERGYTNNRRELGPKHPTFGFRLDSNVGAKWVGVVMFLWETYQSCAELMPTDFKLPKAGPDEAPFPKDDPDWELRHINEFLKSLQTYATDPDRNMIGPGTFCGTCRYLQASSRTELYWEYHARCKAKTEEPGSYSTFLRVANCILKPGIRGGHLRFRGKTQHGMCNICYELKINIRKSRSVDVRQEAYRSYSQHLLSQWLDRQQYWSYRSLSNTWVKTCVEMGQRHFGCDRKWVCLLSSLEDHPKSCSFGFPLNPLQNGYPQNKDRPKFV